MAAPDASDSHDWDESYTGASPPWDLGHPQPTFVRLAEAGALAGELLDAGCGTGEHTILAARHGAHPVGIDVSPRAIEIAMGKAADRGVDATFRVFDALRIAELGTTFDTIIDSGLFHVFDDATRGRYAESVHTALRPGGHLRLMCFSDRQGGDWGPRRVSEAELRAVFGPGWRIASLDPDQFEIKPEFGFPTADAWLADIVRLPSTPCPR